jgi:hypothetical protein
MIIGGCAGGGRCKPGVVCWAGEVDLVRVLLSAAKDGSFDFLQNLGKLHCCVLQG